MNFNHINNIPAGSPPAQPLSAVGERSPVPVLSPERPPALSLCPRTLGKGTAGSRAGAGPSPSAPRAHPKLPETLGNKGGDVLPPEPPAMAAGDKVTPRRGCSSWGEQGRGAAALTAGEGPGISGERRETSSFLPSGNSSPRSQLSVGAQRPRSSHVALETLISLTSGRAAGSQSRGCGRHEKGHRVCTFTKHALKKKGRGKKNPALARQIQQTHTSVQPPCPSTPDLAGWHHAIAFKLIRHRRNQQIYLS